MNTPITGNRIKTTHLLITLIVLITLSTGRVMEIPAGASLQAIIPGAMPAIPPPKILE